MASRPAARGRTLGYPASRRASGGGTPLDALYVRTYPNPVDVEWDPAKANLAACVRRESMKKEYDFSRGTRGAVRRTPPGKTRITIRIDDDVLGWFRTQVHRAGGGSYQTLMNDALRRFIESHEQRLEDTLRRVLREELPRFAGRKAADLTRR